MTVTRRWLNSSAEYEYSLWKSQDDSLEWIYDGLVSDRTATVSPVTDRGMRLVLWWFLLSGKPGHTVKCVSDHTGGVTTELALKLSRVYYDRVTSEELRLARSVEVL